MILAAILIVHFGGLIATIIIDPSNLGRNA
jgi:hypothetical protein